MFSFNASVKRWLGGFERCEEENTNERKSKPTLQLFRRVTSSFLRSLTVAGLDASAALWFFRPFLYRTTGSSAPGSKPLWSRTSGVWSPDRPPQHTVVTHELPCCSLTRPDIIRDGGEKNNTSLFSLGLLTTRPLASLTTNVCFLKRHLCFNLAWKIF